MSVPSWRMRAGLSLTVLARREIPLDRSAIMREGEGALMEHQGVYEMHAAVGSNGHRGGLGAQRAYLTT